MLILGFWTNFWWRVSCRALPLQSSYFLYVFTLLLHQAAAKQNRSNVEEDTIKQQDYSTITSPDTAHYSPQGITECASSSEESLKEITPPSTSPRVEVKQPASIITSQLQETISSNQYQSELSFNPGPRRVSMITFNDHVEELVPSSQGKKKKKTKVSEDANTNTLNSGDYELTAVNRENASAGQDTVDAVTPRKKKKKKPKANSPDSQPPFVRRPLPQLPPQDG